MKNKILWGLLYINRLKFNRKSKEKFIYFLPSKLKYFVYIQHNNNYLSALA